MKTAAVIVAAGSATRFGGAVPKQFLEICGKPLLTWTISRFEQARTVGDIVLVAAEDQLAFVSEKVVDPFGFTKVSRIVSGGPTRQESVLKGLERLPGSTHLVAIHDGARPLTLPSDIDRVVEAAAKERAALLAAPATDTIKRVEQGFVVTTLNRQVLYLAQTPQVFHYDLILAAHREAAAHPDSSTDDAALVEAGGVRVCVIEPAGANLKVTTRQDLMLAEALLRGELEQ